MSVEGAAQRVNALKPLLDLRSVSSRVHDGLIAG